MTRLMNLGMVLALMCCGCRRDAGSGRPAPSLSALRVAMCTVDLGRIHAKGWTAMQLCSVFSPETPLLVSGRTISLADVIRRTDIGGQPPMLVSFLGHESARPSSFRGEYEDHLGEYEACCAIGADLAGVPDGDPSWEARAQRFLDYRASDLQEETSWVILMGTTVIGHLADAGSRARCEDRLRKITHSAIWHRGRPACGGCHYTTALTSAMRAGLVSSEDQLHVLAWCGDFRKWIAVNLTDTGYVNLPGLDENFPHETANDRLSVLGHIVGVLSALGPPHSPDEMRIMSTFRDELLSACNSQSISSRALGDACYGIAGLLQLERLAIR